MSSATRTYIGVVCAGAALVLWGLLALGRPEAVVPLLGFIALSFVTENYAFQLPLAGSVSLSSAVVYAALLYSGPVGAVAAAVAASVTVGEIRAKKPLATLSFNVGQLALSSGIAGIVYHLLGGRTIAMNPGIGSHLLPILAAAGVLFVVNMLLVGQLVSMMQRTSLRRVLNEQRFLSYAVSHLVLVLLGLIMAHLLAQGSWLGLLLLLLPFLAARRTFRVYAELTEAYTSTVRSLVTAIEAKDPYTRGHSERVAVYARQLGERLALSRADLELLERAALLHDVGKIGIELDTLTSPSQLAAEEVRAIRQHPVIGSELVSDVEFLIDTVPTVRHHHERFDGAGYPDGLIGDEIPMLARVLAVVDSYDAMTSDRAYRTGMSEEQALTEIMRVAGTQLDDIMAHSFAELIRANQGQGADG